MCGIIASFGNYSKSKIIQSTEVIKHRGPDDTQYLFLDNFGCGFVRLSIVDIEGGTQPISNEDNTIFLVCNGEIYNYKDLFYELKKTHTFKTNSDAEIILHLYEDQGEKCIDNLEGMYAFIIYDSVKNKIIAGRDHIGIKPLFYKINKDSVYFSSELKVYDVTVPDNKVSLIEKQVFGFVLNTSETIFKDIKQIKPNSVLSIYADFSTSIYESEHNFKDESLEDCLLSAVETHLINSDVEVGIALSGGLDSSLISALCKQIKPNIKTFVISNRKDSEDVYYASLLAKKYDFDHTELILKRHSHIKDFNYVLDYILNDDGLGAFENIGDLAVFLFYKEVSKYVKVILSGDGADELLGGYWMHKKPLGFKDKLIARSNSSKFNTLLSTVFPEDNEALGRLHVLDILFDLALPNYHLWTLDRCSMRFGVESRVPYLDIKVINNIVKRDVRDRIGKKLLMPLYKKYLPDEIINRNKYGFVDAFREMEKDR